MEEERKNDGGAPVGNSEQKRQEKKNAIKTVKPNEVSINAPSATKNLEDAKRQINPETEATTEATQNCHPQSNKQAAVNLNDSISSLGSDDLKEFENTKLAEPLGSKTEAQLIEEAKEQNLNPVD